MTPRQRNFWAWGWADRFPDDDARRALAARAGAALGGGDLALGALPRLDDARVPEPRVSVPTELSAFASADRFERVTHTYGRAYRDVLRGYRGDFSAAPDVVLRPRDEAEIVRAIRWCEQENVALVPFGGGTSVVGGVEATSGDRYRGVASLDLGAFDRVLEIDAKSRAAKIQAGARGPVLEEQLAPHGLSLRFYPQSFEHATLGGWIATRAGGHFATRLTHIDDLVESIRMVTPRGVIESRRLPASGAGPSPDRALLGSEGILGIITEAWVRVQARPRWRSSASVFFDDLPAAANAARAVVQSGEFPANCRALDAREAMMNGVPTDGGAVLVLGFESADRDTASSMANALSVGLASGGRCPNGAKHRDAGERGGDPSAETWREAFLGAPYLQSALVTLGVIADTFETGCTWDRFDELHAAVLEATTEAMQRCCGAGFVTCRLTHVYPDGVAPYFTFVAPARQGGELEQWGEIKRAASDALLAHGGTITHHHAVGRMHRPWYDRQRPELFAEALRAMKRTLDPHGIMNPGVLVDP
jgi:alkyldihydroxyacetonephosphate synthase